MVGGGWFPSHEAIHFWNFQPLFNCGFTVFAVVHGSNPRFIITQIVPNIHRALRFIRHHDAKSGANPGLAFARRRTSVGLLV